MLQKKGEVEGGQKVGEGLMGGSSGTLPTPFWYFGNLKSVGNCFFEHPSHVTTLTSLIFPIIFFFKSVNEDNKTHFHNSSI